MVFICTLGSVPFGVGLKGKEGHAFGPSKNKQNNIYYLYIFHYAYDSSPEEVLPKTSILSVRPHGVHAYFGLGTVCGWAKKERKGTLLDPQSITKSLFTISISFIMPTIHHLMKFCQTQIFYQCHPMVFICILGSVPFGVGLKGKEGHAFGPSKNKQNNIYYLYIFHYAYDSSPDEVLPRTSILTVRPHGVHAYFGLGAVCGRVKGKGRPPLVGVY